MYSILVFGLTLLCFLHPAFTSHHRKQQQTCSSQNCTVAEPDCIACNQPAKCKDVPTLNLNFGQGLNEGAPFFEPLLLKRFDTEPIDNVCNTFFPFDHCGTFLHIRSVVYNNGSGLIETFIIKEKAPGQLRTQGRTSDAGIETSRIANEFIFNSSSSDCPQILIMYKCYVYDLCRWVDSDTDFRFAISSSLDISPSCLDKVEAQLNDPILDFRGSQFVRPGHKLQQRCVTNFNGARCINANRVSKRNSISLP